MAKNKILSLAVLSGLAGVLTVGAYAGSMVQILAEDKPCAHVGNHYAGIEAGVITEGTSEYYMCCKCHTVILGSEHTAGDGTWTDAASTTQVEKAHKAYLEPTVDAATVNAQLALAGESLTTSHVPTSLDKNLYDKIGAYKAAYLSKEGTSENDLTGLENYRGLGNELGIYNVEDLASSSGSTGSRYNVYQPGSNTIVRNLRDEENCIDYAKITYTNDVTKYSTAVFLYGGLFNGANGDVQVMVRPSITLSFYVYAFSSRAESTSTTCNAGEWTPITIPYAMVQRIQTGMADPNVTYNTTYLSNNAALSIGDTIDIGDISVVEGSGLGDYDCYSNEGYATLYTAGGLAGTIGTSYQTGNSWFSGCNTPVFHPDYRSVFIETFVSNNSGADKTYSDLLVSNAYYGGIYFSVGNYTFSATPTELFFLIHANEEVNIKYSKFGDIVRKGSEGTVVKESKLYKGWNAIHLNIDKANPKAYSFKGHTFSIVPEVWSTTLTITNSAMFVKAAA